MGLFDDFVVGKIDQFEAAINKVSDELSSTADRVERGSQHVDSVIDRATNSVKSGAEKVEQGSVKIDESIRSAVSGVTNITGGSDDAAESHNNQKDS